MHYGSCIMLHFWWLKPNFKPAKHRRISFSSLLKSYRNNTELNLTNDEIKMSEMDRL